jgi:hypothetical protein
MAAGVMAAGVVDGARVMAAGVVGACVMAGTGMTDLGRSGNAGGDTVSEASVQCQALFQATNGGPELSHSIHVLQSPCSRVSLISA